MVDEPQRVVTPYEGTGHQTWDDSAYISAPLYLHETPVHPRWVDYNGHMSESCYLLVFGDNSDAFFRYIGIGEDYRARGRSLYTVESHLHNLREVAEGELLRLSLRLLDHDHKRVHLFHEMWNATEGHLLATGEQMLVHVDVEQGRSLAMSDDLQHRLRSILLAHNELAVPDVVGRPMGIPRNRG